MAHASWHESDASPSFSRYSIFAGLGTALSSSSPPRHLKPYIPGNILSSFNAAMHNHLIQSLDPESQSQSSSTGTSQPPNLSNSQWSERSEELIKTPIVTPNGSLIFNYDDDDDDDGNQDHGSAVLDTSSLPESQVERIHHHPSEPVLDISGNIPDVDESQPTWQSPSEDLTGDSSQVDSSTDSLPVSSEEVTTSTSEPPSNLINGSSLGTNDRHSTLAALLSPVRRSKRLDRDPVYDGLSLENESKRYTLRKRRASTPITAFNAVPDTPQRRESAGSVVTAYCAKLRSHSPPKSQPIKEDESERLLNKRKKRASTISTTGTGTGEMKTKDNDSEAESGRGKGKRVRVSSDCSDKVAAAASSSHTSEKEPTLRRSPRKKR